MGKLFALMLAFALGACVATPSYVAPPVAVPPYTGPMRELTAIEKKVIAEKVSRAHPQ